MDRIAYRIELLKIAVKMHQDMEAPQMTPENIKSTADGLEAWLLKDADDASPGL